MSQYDKSKKPDEFFLITHFITRRLAYPLARLFQRIGLSPNAVTVIGGLTWVSSVITALLAGWYWQKGNVPAAWVWLLLTAVLWNTGFILDVADGSLARMTDTACPSGFFLDFYFHLFFHPMFLCSIGVFLYLAGSGFVFLLLGVLSICCNWGVSFSAKEHVLCEDIAKGRFSPDRLPAAERYAIYIDSLKTKTPVVAKYRGWRLLRTLAEEIVTFPGQFTLFGIVVLADFLLFLRWKHDFVLLKPTFLIVTVVMLARTPFRLRREFRTMRRYQEYSHACSSPGIPGRGKSATE